MPSPKSYKFHKIGECEFINRVNNRSKIIESVISSWYYNGSKFESGWVASIVIEANGICHRKSKQGKKEGSNVFNDYEAGSRANNVILSGKDVCKRCIAFS